MANQYNYPPIADSRALYKRMKHHEARLYGLHFQRAHEPVLAAALEAELEARWPETGFKDVSEGGLSLEALLRPKFQRGQLGSRDWCWPIG